MARAVSETSCGVWHWCVAVSDTDGADGNVWHWCVAVSDTDGAGGARDQPWCLALVRERLAVVSGTGA
jgi:hypothetical protein